MLLSLKEAGEAGLPMPWWSPGIAHLHHVLMMVSRRIALGKWERFDPSKFRDDADVQTGPIRRCDECGYPIGSCLHTGEV